MKAISLLVLITLGACSSFHKEVDPVTEPIRAPLLSKMPEMRECYKQSESYKKNIPEVKFKYHFVINADGTTSDHKISDSTVPEKKFEDCIKNVVGSLRFPPTAKGGTVEVKQPFNFYPKSVP